MIGAASGSFMMMASTEEFTMRTSSSLADPESSRNARNISRNRMMNVEYGSSDGFTPLELLTSMSPPFVVRFIYVHTRIINHPHTIRQLAWSKVYKPFTFRLRLLSWTDLTWSSCMAGVRAKERDPTAGRSPSFGLLAVLREGLACLGDHVRGDLPRRVLRLCLARVVLAQPGTQLLPVLHAEFLGKGFGSHRLALRLRRGLLLHRSLALRGSLLGSGLCRLLLGLFDDFYHVVTSLHT